MAPSPLPARKKVSLWRLHWVAPVKVPHQRTGWTGSARVRAGDSSIIGASLKGNPLKYWSSYTAPSPGRCTSSSVSLSTPAVAELLVSFFWGVLMIRKKRLFSGSKKKLTGV